MDLDALRHRVEALEREIDDREAERDDARDKLGSAVDVLAECAGVPAGEMESALDEPPVETLSLDYLDTDNARALRNRIALLEDHVELVEADRDRHRDAVEQTVEASRTCAKELESENEVVAPVRSEPARQREGNCLRDGLSVIGKEIEVRLNGSVEVRGTLRSHSDCDFVLVIELVREGVVVDSVEREMEVRGGEVPVSEILYPPSGPGRYTALISWR